MSEERGPAGEASAVALLLPQPTHRFPVLDLLRGVAALVVVCIHDGAMFGGSYFHHGYLAVDFFFMLSGFVLTLAYQDRLDAGWATWRFMRVRVIRLWPLYVLALALMLGYLVKVARQPVSWQRMGWPLLLALVMLPATPWRRDGYAYTFNMPSWSLVLELLANVFQAVCLRRATLRVLAMTAVAAGLAVVLVVVHFGTVDVGALMVSLPAALPRTLFSYVVGMILFRVWQSGRWRVRVPAVGIVAALLLGLTGPQGKGSAVFYDAGVVLLLFPAMLYAGACAVTSPGVRRVADLLGRSSYAVYVIHFPLMFWWPSVLHRARLDRLDQYVPLNGIAFLVFTFVLAVLLDGFYDGPVRGYLLGRRKRPSAA